MSKASWYIANSLPFGRSKQQEKKNDNKTALKLCSLQWSSKAFCYNKTWTFMCMEAQYWRCTDRKISEFLESFRDFWTSVLI